MKLVSVIIPVYNVEKYLDRCVESVVNQTYRDLEIILVNDGSPDNCPVMCDEWAKKDERIKVIHKVNGGLSSARNAGLDICTGDYIMFLDSDDWYDKETVNLCFLSMTNHYADIVTFGIRNVSENKIVGIKGIEEGFHFDTTVRELFVHGDSVCNKMFKKCLWNNLRFQEGIVFEDGYIMSNMYSLTNRVFSLSTAYYNYYNDNTGSILHIIQKDPREPWYRWKYESHIVEQLASKIEVNLLRKMKTKILEHALKAYIVDLAKHCLGAEERMQICKYITDAINDTANLKMEYRLYSLSFRGLNILNRIKSLEYLWKYRQT